MAVHWELEHQCARRLYRSGLREWQELRIREGVTAECAAVAATHEANNLLIRLK